MQDGDDETETVYHSMIETYDGSDDQPARTTSALPINEDYMNSSPPPALYPSLPSVDDAEEEGDDAQVNSWANVIRRKKSTTHGDYKDHSKTKSEKMKKGKGKKQIQRNESDESDGEMASFGSDLDHSDGAEQERFEGENAANAFGLDHALREDHLQDDYDGENENVKKNNEDEEVMEVEEDKMENAAIGEDHQKQQHTTLPSHDHGDHKGQRDEEKEMVIPEEEMSVKEQLPSPSRSNHQSRSSSKETATTTTTTTTTTIGQHGNSDVALVDRPSAFEPYQEMFASMQVKSNRDVQMVSTGKENTVLRIKCMDKDPDAIWNAAPGINGENGAHGVDGVDQHPATNGERGEDGERGHAGSNGQSGKPGHHGRAGIDAHSLYLKLERENERICLQGSIESKQMRLENGSVIHVDGRGGRGENGGYGGKGGKGGNGGAGGAGGKGGNASLARQVGGTGGNGGHGGNAGSGGNGGHGGNGGNGGRGANILLETTDPSLFALVDCNVIGGDGGSGGKEGAPGDNGQPGIGGKGGKGGLGKPPAGDGQDGFNGKKGMAAQGAKPGTSGKDGSKGEDGGVCFVVKSHDGTIVEKGSRRYNAHLTGFTVRGLDHDDGVLEPGERVAISQIQVHNDGDLTLPEGCSIRVARSNSFIPDEPQSYTLPKIVPGETYITDFDITGSIAFDSKQNFSSEEQQYEKLSNRYLSVLELMTECSLHGRVFSNSQLRREFRVEYPLRIERMIAQTVMAPQENAEFRVEFSNISNMHYHSKNVSISYRIYLYDHFVNHERQGEQIIQGNITEIAPHSAIVVTIPLTMQASEDDLYKMLPWYVELEFKDRLIEMQKQFVRVCPPFDPKPRTAESDSESHPSDLLFISDLHITHTEYLLYRRIFDGLGLRISHYDLELNATETIPGASHLSDEKAQRWVGHFRGKPIVLPLADPHSVLKRINGRDITTHFTSMSYHDNADKFDSGMLVVGDVTARGGFSNILLNKLFQYSKYHLELTGNDFSESYIVNEPTREDMQAKMKEIVATHGKDQPSQIYRMFLLEYAPRRLGWATYAYGRAQLKQLPLNRIHRMLFLGHTNETMSHSPQYLSNGLKQMEIQQMLQGNNFFTDSNMFEMLLGVLCSLSVEKKCEMIMRYKELPAVRENWSFIIRSTTSTTLSPSEQHEQRQQHEEQQQSSWMQRLSNVFSGSTTRQAAESIRKIDILDVIRTVLYDDLKREFFFNDQGIDRVERMIQYVKRHRNKFLTYEGVYSVWFVLSRLETHTYWRTRPILSALTEKRNLLLETKRKFEDREFNFTAHSKNPHTVTITHSKEKVDDRNRSSGISTSKNKEQLLDVDFAALQKEKERAAQDAKGGSRLKLQDLSRRLFYPLESTDM